jgi:hypothetical protein
MPNNQFDKNVFGLGYCCPYGFIRIHVKPTDSLTVLAKKAGVCRNTLKKHRRGVRNGTVKCLKRNECLKALWLSPAARRLEAKREEEAAALALAEAAALVNKDK